MNIQKTKNVRPKADSECMLKSIAETTAFRECITELTLVNNCQQFEQLTSIFKF